jgi:DNA-binding NtrC family response regulator
MIEPVNGRGDTTKIVERPPTSGARRTLRIEVTAGPAAGKSVSLGTGHGVVGRSAAADVPIEDETVSQFHVDLVASGETIVVVDLGSRNGTRADQVFLERGRIPSGGRLTLGATEIAIACGAEATATRSTSTTFGNLVGAAPVMREVYAMLEKLAPARLGVLIEGATGTGKELAARALHEQGPRAPAPFVAIDCAALPPAIAEIVFFGEEVAPGASDGASRPGVFAAAGAGTLLLDHVGDLPLELQGKLLRALDQREIMPVGTATPRRFEARIVSVATNLRELVNRGAFREDLYFRLAQARIAMPSLEEHPEDKRPLATHFLALADADAAPDSPPRARSFTPDALDAIASRVFPGNVRELRNVVERAAVVAEGTSITVQDLAFERVLAATASAGGARAGDAGTIDDDDDGRGEADDPEETVEAFKDAKRTVIDEFERRYLTRLLARSGKNVSRAAAIAGIERQSLRDLLKRHGLDRNDERRR